MFGGERVRSPSLHATTFKQNVSGVFGFNLRFISSPVVVLLDLARLARCPLISASFFSVAVVECRDTTKRAFRKSRFWHVRGASKGRTVACPREAPCIIS